MQLWTLEGVLLIMDSPVYVWMLVLIATSDLVATTLRRLVAYATQFTLRDVPVPSIATLAVLHLW
jgi:hypothetical protein